MMTVNKLTQNRKFSFFSHTTPRKDVYCCFTQLKKKKQKQLWRAAKTVHDDCLRHINIAKLFFEGVAYTFGKIFSN